MTGIRALRRSSGEIINATLLEVFLSVTFIVFALAVFEQQRANDAEQRAVIAEAALNRNQGDASSAAQAHAALRAARDSMTSMRAAQVANATRLDSMTRLVRSLQFNSRIPPDCEGQPGEAPWLTVTIRDESTLAVRVGASRFGFQGGQEFVVAPREFASRFGLVRAYSEAHGCRFPAQIVDTDNSSKAAYKRALGAVSTTFRLRGFLR
jgi:hypothetical protein